MNKQVKPLYRKVNTRARNVHHFFGSDARYDRNTKSGVKKNLRQGDRRGLDYTPLFMFLLSKVGEDWDKVHSEAISRLDREAPIYWMVAIHEKDKKDYVRCGDSSKYSGLYVDEDNKLQKVNPNFKNEDLYPSCSCCTHTFNGKKLNNKYRSEHILPGAQF